MPNTEKPINVVGQHPTLRTETVFRAVKFPGTEVPQRPSFADLRSASQISDYTGSREDGLPYPSFAPSLRQTLISNRLRTSHRQPMDTPTIRLTDAEVHTFGELAALADEPTPSVVRRSTMVQHLLAHPPRGKAPVQEPDYLRINYVDDSGTNTVFFRLPPPTQR